MASRDTIGKAVAQARKTLGATQKQMAERTGIHKTTLSEIENGRFTGSLDIFERYLDAVGLQLEVIPKQHQLPDWDDIENLFDED
ncbi:helix-turn-helix domain-containing protein [Photobacterium sp. CCB-ST2H9]|uniref:helix-turn-helix domain-containing protein n=1 Tax=Photobacterium sp. CCB-ST2H9 TaxID=2912855 RepID=UPI002005FF91|nr:helix-turn-helix transcriptional regulator [Photobacterium sp. CCB-ST2H9]UTM60070.1 helix-turn-helix domain-containing protein [Photobacterium sp. CCB-ST2H9]